jgi:hypothetical protein
MLAPSGGHKFNDEKSLFLVGAQCLRPPEGASIAPLQSTHLDRATLEGVTTNVKSSTTLDKTGVLCYISQIMMPDL